MGDGSIHDSDHASGAGAISEQRFADALQAAYPLLLSIALGMLGNRSDAEDLVQEAALIGWRKRADYRPGSHFAAWMSAVVRNAGLNARRKRRRRDTLPLDEAQAGQARDEPASPADARTGALQPDQQAFDDAVQAALLTLDPVPRACLLLRTVHGLDFAQIAELMDVPKNTALSHVHRARQAMRRSLTQAEKGAAP